METNNKSYKFILIGLIQIVLISCAKNNIQLKEKNKHTEYSKHYENFNVTFDIRNSHTISSLKDVAIILNKNKEFSSDKNGLFKYYAKKGDTLVFKLKGYETQEVIIENDQYINYLIDIYLKETPIIKYMD